MPLPMLEAIWPRCVERNSGPTFVGNSSIDK
jgi:hypothetical protein